MGGAQRGVHLAAGISPTDAAPAAMDSGQSADHNDDDMHTSGPRPDVHLELHTGDQARASALYANLPGWRRRLIEAGCGS